MSRSVIIIATLALITPVLAAEPPKSGNFKTASAFKGIEESSQIGGRVMSSRGSLRHRHRGESAPHQDREVSLHQRDRWRYGYTQGRMCLDRWGR